jgi:hypothetical protein
VRKKLIASKRLAWFRVAPWRAIKEFQVIDLLG